MVMAGIKNKIIPGEFYNEVINEMTASNLLIYQLFKKHKIRNITDISGFGLVSHLKNLLLRNKVFKGANIYLDKVLMLEGAKLAMENEVTSSLTYSNKDSINNTLHIIANDKKYLNILFDPQTAGGFLFIINNRNKIIKDFKNNNITFSEIGNVSFSHDKIKVL